MFSNAPRLFVSASVALTLLLSLGSPTHASFVVNVIESGGDVVATGSGTLDLTDLIFDQFASPGRFIIPAQAEVSLGALGTGQGTIWDQSGQPPVGISGPSSFGHGTGPDSPTSGTGDIVGLEISSGRLGLAVPQGYVSGSQLNSSDAWSGATFSSLGLTPGTYVWTWGSGADADFFTMNIGASSVPEPASLMMLGTGSLAILGFARRRRRASA